MLRARDLLFVSFLSASACTAPTAIDETLDLENDCGTCFGKVDGFEPPAEGSCGALSMVALANDAAFEVLDDDVGLNRRAAQNLVEARESERFEHLADVDDVSYVGPYAMSRLFDYVEASGAIAECETSDTPEIGVISDLDKTVIPPGDLDDLDRAPYPGVRTLYEILEYGSTRDGQPGDFTYVTARSPDRIDGVPAYLAEWSMPEAPIETGISGVPWVAQAEKVRDISRTFDADDDARPYVLFGDTSHRDPAAYREILALYPGRVLAGLIHKVNRTVSPHRIEGLHMHESYPEAAAILVGLGVITEADANEVYADAVDEGLEMSPDEFEALLDEHARH